MTESDSNNPPFKLNGMANWKWLLHVINLSCLSCMNAYHALSGGSIHVTSAVVSIAMLVLAGVFFTMLLIHRHDGWGFSLRTQAEQWDVVFSGSITACIIGYTLTKTAPWMFSWS